jgi:hypothetical protein
MLWLKLITFGQCSARKPKNKKKKVGYSLVSELAKVSGAL